MYLTHSVCNGYFAPGAFRLETYAYPSDVESMY